jgi:hypothetical protein
MQQYNKAPKLLNSTTALNNDEMLASMAKDNSKQCNCRFQKIFNMPYNATDYVVLVNSSNILAYR